MSGYQLLERSIKVAQSLVGNDVAAGDGIGLFSSNCLEYAYVVFGSIICGAKVSPLNVTYTVGTFENYTIC